MSQATIITGPERRRAFSEAQKLELLAAAFGPGGKVAEVARGADICSSLLYRWRRTFTATRSAPAFIPAIVTHEVRSPSPVGPVDTVIVVEQSGVTVKIAAAASPALITATLRALR